MKKKRILSFLLATVMASGLLAGCSSDEGKKSSGNEDGGKKDSIVIATMGETPSLSPTEHNAVAGSYMNILTYNTLFKTSMDLEPVPDLVDSYENVDDSTWHFKLKEGVKFHNGDTMTADDVVASLQWAQGFAEVNLYNKNFISISKVDDLTVAGKMLSPLLGNAATVVFALALLLAGISSSITAGMAGGTIFSGIFNQPYDIKTKETKRGVLLTMIPAAVIILFIRQPFEGLVYSQMLLAVQLPVTIFTQIYLTASKKVMGKYVNSRRLNFLLLVIAVIVTGLNIALLFV